MKAIIVAFSMYSKIPMPRVDWTKKTMRYALCFFPLIGVVIGAMTVCMFYLMQAWNKGVLLQTALLLILPLLVTGGIHLDGFLDTMDARSSHQEREKKLEILKDPHIGAFAVIGCVIYYLSTFGFMSEITEESIWFVAMGFVYSRTLSGLSVVSLRGAKLDGTLATFSDMAQKRTVQVVMCIYLTLMIGAMLWLSPFRGGIVSLSGVVIFGYYRFIAYKEFGGITGDLAGYFVQICELGILIAAVSCPGQ